MAARIKKGDRVIVLAGRDIGKTGQVLGVFRDKDRVLVQGVNIIKRHTKPSQADPQGGIQTREASIHMSNVAHIDPGDGKATRIGFKIDEYGHKTRYAKRSGESIDG